MKKDTNLPSNIHLLDDILFRMYYIGESPLTQIPMEDLCQSPGFVSMWRVWKRRLFSSDIEERKELLKWALDNRGLDFKGLGRPVNLDDHTNEDIAYVIEAMYTKVGEIFTDEVLQKMKPPEDARQLKIARINNEYNQEISSEIFTMPGMPRCKTQIMRGGRGARRYIFQHQFDLLLLDAIDSDDDEKNINLKLVRGIRNVEKPESGFFLFRLASNARTFFQLNALSGN